MAQRWSRRSIFGLTSGFSALGISLLATKVWGQLPASPPSVAGDVFPALDPALVREAVGVSHRDLKRAQELVERQPALARVSIDWGFGDWESCLDAASHTGNKAIADFLLTNGARPTIFSAAMMGQLDVVKAFIAARPGVQRNLGPHGLTLMWHAKQGGSDAAAVVQYLTTVGDADVSPATLPLATQDRDALVGRYTYGSGPRDHFTIEVRNGKGVGQLQAAVGFDPRDDVVGRGIHVWAAAVSRELELLPMGRDRAHHGLGQARSGI